MEEHEDDGPAQSRPRAAPSREASTRAPHGRSTGVRASEIALAALVALVVVGSALALGAVHVPVLVTLAPLSFVAAALAMRAELARKSALSITTPALIAFALAGYTLLQAAPIPMAWLERLAPANADVWARALLPFGEPGPRSASLSLDPGASLVEALKWASYGALFTASAAFARRRGATFGVALVFASALAVALATVLHGLLSATKVYGFYTPQVPLPPWHVGPLINTNTLAGYLNLGVFAGAGLLLMHEPIAPRWLVAPAVALLVAVEVTSASRGGVVALILGVLLLAALSYLKGRRRGGDGHGVPKSVLWLASGALLFGAILAALGGTTDTWNELYDKNLGKLEMIRWTEPMVREHPLFGVGRGAFESVFPAYRLTQGHVVFAYAEDFPAQWATEWGLPVAIAALVGFAICFRPSHVGATRSRLAAAAFSGVAVVLLQNLVDLSLEIPAVCCALAVMLGSLSGDRARSRPSSSRETRSSGARGLRGRLVFAAPFVTIAAGIGLSFAALRLGHPDVGAERAAMRRAFEAASPTDPASHGELRGALRGAMLRHPAEPYFSLVGALSAFRTKSESALPWLQRALERGHVNGRAHLLLAEVLASRGARKQALLELRIAAEQDSAMVGHGGTLAMRFTQDFDELSICVPEGESGAAMLDELGLQAQNRKLDALRSRLDRAAIERSKDAYGPRIREAAAMIDAIARGATVGLCGDVEACAHHVEEHAAALALSRPDESIADQLRARLSIAMGKPEEAEARLLARCPHVKDRAACLRARVEAAAKLTAVNKVDAAGKELLAAECLTSARCAEAASWLASVREGRGDTGASLSLYERAAREDPTEARLLKLASAASRAGAHARAADAYDRAAQKRGGDGALRQKAAEERARAFGGKSSP